MTEYTQADLLALMRPDKDALKDEIVARKEFEEAFRLAWDAAIRLEGNDRAQTMAFSRLAQLRLSRDKQTAAVLSAPVEARDLTPLNLVELQVLAYYTSLADGEPISLEGLDIRSRGIIDLLRSVV